MDRPLCANGCGFYGSLENQNLCSKCYKDFQKQEHASKAAKEDTEPQEEEEEEEEDANMIIGPLPCDNGCGFFGMSEKKNLCSKCYNIDFLKEETEKTTAKDDKEPVLEKPVINSDAQSCLAPDIGASTSVMKNKCKTCNKKTGLTGFECRCGNLFCGMHRYPEEHGCTVDLKAIGQDLLAKDNPVCKGDKLQWRL